MSMTGLSSPCPCREHRKLACSKCLDSLPYHLKWIPRRPQLEVVVLVVVIVTLDLISFLIPSLGPNSWLRKPGKYGMSAHGLTL